jgi:hypothetical protein
MTHNIIKTENYLLIVSDEIPTTWYYDTYINQVRHTGGAEYGESSITKKVIGHLPLNNSPVLKGVPLLPPLEDEQSLQQPKMPVGFECEDEYVHDDTVPYPKTLGTHPKTIVNPQGQTVLVGKYIY